MMRTIARNIRDAIFPKDEPLITISIHEKALLGNLHAYQNAYPDAVFAPVLKSNAYGHGLCLVARILEKESIAFFMVDSLYEARKLRRGGIKKRILVMGYVRPTDIAGCTLPQVDFAVTSLSQLNELASLATGKTRIHLKIDSGMHRQGVLPEELDEAISLIQGNSSLTLSGVCSHFADADGEDSKLTRRQIERFTTSQDKLVQVFGDIPFRHISATKGAPYLRDTDTNVVRLGIGLYGFDTSATHQMNLTPALSMNTTVSSVRTILRGESVGYNGTYTNETEETLATIPTGYYEGVDRALSNTGGVYIKNIWCPFRGRISMNMSTVGVSNVPEIRPGDDVLVVSNNTTDKNSVAQMAEDAGTTPYVILVHFPEHLKRIIV